MKPDHPHYKYTYGSVEEAMPAAERHCRRDGRIWIMEDEDGRFHVINPYSKDIERHYLQKLGWKLAKQLETVVQETAFA